MIATETFKCEYDGAVVEITAGISSVCDDHEIARRYPDRFRPEAGGRRRRTPMRAAIAPAAVRPATSHPAWQLEPRPPADWRNDDFTRRRTARHEAAHAVMAHLLGWAVEAVELREYGGGSTDVISPAGLDTSRRERERAVITLAGRIYEGYSSSDGDRQDQAEVWEAVSAMTTSPAETLEFRARLRAYTAARVATTEFRNLAKRIEDALFEHGRLGAVDMRELFAGRDLDATAARAHDLAQRNAGASWLLGAA